MRARFQVVRRQRDRGLVTAEYAMGMLAACGFATLLYKVLTGNSILGLVTKLVGRALHLT